MYYMTELFSFAIWHNSIAILIALTLEFLAHMGTVLQRAWLLELSALAPNSAMWPSYLALKIEANTLLYNWARKGKITMAKNQTILSKFSFLPTFKVEENTVPSQF